MRPCQKEEVNLPVDTTKQRPCISAGPLCVFEVRLSHSRIGDVGVM